MKWCHGRTQISSLLLSAGMLFGCFTAMGQVPVNERIGVNTLSAEVKLDPQTGWTVSTAELQLTNLGNRSLNGPFFFDIVLGGTGDLSVVQVENAELVSGASPVPRWRFYPAGTGEVSFAPGEQAAISLVIRAPSQVQVVYHTDAWANIAFSQVRQLSADADLVVTTDATQSDFDPSTGTITSSASGRIRNTGPVPFDGPLYMDVALSGPGPGSLTWVEDAVRITLTGESPVWRSQALAGSGLGSGLDLPMEIVIHRSSQERLSYSINLQESFAATPLAAFSIPETITAGEFFTLDGSASADPGGEALNYYWHVPDGELEGMVVPTSLQQPGSYEIYLKVTNESGASHQVARQILVLPDSVFAVGRVRALDQSGQPLGSTSIQQTYISDGMVNLLNCDREGFAVLGGKPGEYVWQFSKEGYVSAWRKQTIAERKVSWIPSPWMTKVSQDAITVSPLADSTFSSGSGGCEFKFPAGTFSDTSAVQVTELSQQALPYPLPLGWTPVVTFRLDADNPLLGPGEVRIKNDSGFSAGTWVWLDEPALDWTVLVPGISSTESVLFENTGTYAYLVGDAGPTAPPVPVQGTALQGTGIPVPPGTEVTASGSVDPEVALASDQADLLTARAAVVFSSGEPIPSGSVFRTRIHETYHLNGGQEMHTATYDTSFSAYRAIDQQFNRVAEFPLRPRFIVPPEDLFETLIVADVYSLDSFSAGIVGSSGATYKTGNITLTIPGTASGTFGVVEVQRVDPAVVQEDLELVETVLAFELLGPTVADSEYGLIVNGLVAGKDYLLVRNLEAVGAGLQPVLRMRTDASGVARSVEPESGMRLPGISGSGQYILVALPQALGIVHGHVGNLQGQFEEGFLVSIADSPWLNPTNNAGGFILVAPAGAGTVRAVNPVDDNIGSADFVMEPSLNPVNVDFNIGLTLPVVAAVSPEDGSDGVSLVKAIEVVFNKEMNPASLGVAGMVLRDPSGEIVQASVSMNRAGTVATLLTYHPFLADTVYTLELSPALEDVHGNAIDGLLVFSFKTRQQAVRNPGAKLVIHEPDAQNVPQEVLDQLVGYNPSASLSMVVAAGSAGVADPEVPVILVNETTGETATVVSRPDGSFASFIRAEEEDYITATFVNLNGTRVTVPATEQHFDNGKLGLYRYGGILEAESDGGPVQVFVEPEAIPERTVFDLNPLSVAQLLQHMGGVVPPGDGQILAGFELEMEGDELELPMKISVPVDPATIDLPDGTGPQDAGYVLAQKLDVDGVTVFEVLDKMVYEDGSLHTASPPFSGAVYPGILMCMKAYSGSWAVLSGTAYSTNGSWDPATGDHKPLLGAIITAHFEGAGVLDESRTRLYSGQYVSVTNSRAGYALMVEVINYEQGLDARANGFVLTGVSSRLPGVVGFGHATVPILEPYGHGDVYFDRNAAVSLIGGDSTLPEIRFFRSGINPSLNVPFSLKVSGVDGSGIMGIDTIINRIDVLPGVDGVPPGLIPGPANLSFAEEPAGISHETATVSSKYYKIKADYPMRLTLTAEVTDSETNTAQADTTIDIGLPMVIPEVIEKNFADYEGPFIMDTAPVHGDDTYDRFRPITIVFSEPIHKSIVEQPVFTAVKMFPYAGEPELEMSDDQTTLTLYYPDLRSDTDYEMTVLVSQVIDVSGNHLNHILGYRDPPDDVIKFKTRKDFDTSLPLIYGGGITRIGDTYYALDRTFLGNNDTGSNEAGKLIVFKIDDSGSSIDVASKDLPNMPRDIVPIENWSYRFRNTNRENRNLVVIAGGVPISFENPLTENAWIRVYDVTIPGSPEFIAGSSAFGESMSLITKLDWAAPILGMLEVGEQFNVHYVDLQLMITSKDRSVDWSGFQPGGVAGVDADGDGAYTSPGDILPEPSSIGLQYGLINGGLVGTYGFPDIPGARITDFSIGFAGRYLGIAGGVSDTEGRYQTILWNGIPAMPDAYHAFAGYHQPRRLTTLFGVEVVDYLGDLKIMNLALVSAGDRLFILDISQPYYSASVLDEIRFDGSERPQSAYVADNGYVAVATDKDMYIFDPNQFGLGSPGGLAGEHPAHRYRLTGAGTRSYSFVSNGEDMAVVCFGGKNAIIAQEPFSVSSYVQQIEPIKITDKELPPPQGPFFIAGKQPLRYPIGGVLSIVVKDVAPGWNFSGGGLLDSLSKAVKLKKPTGAGDNDRKVTFEALIDPPDKTPEEGFPEWTMGSLKQNGKKATFPFPPFKGTRPSPGEFWRESGFTPDQYDVTCETENIRVNVYPSEVRAIEISIKDLVGEFEKLSNVFDTLSGDVIGLGTDTIQIEVFKSAHDKVKSMVQGYGKIAEATLDNSPADMNALMETPMQKSRKSEGPDDMKFSFANKWEECNDPASGRSNQVNLTYLAQASFDPLIKASGQLDADFPLPVGAGSLRMEVGLKLSGQLGLSIDFHSDACSLATQHCGNLNGKINAEIWGEVSVLYIIGAKLTVGTGLSTDAKVCANFNTRKVTATFDAKFDGVTLVPSLTMFAGILEKKADPIPVIEPYPFTPVTFELYSF